MQKQILKLLFLFLMFFVLPNFVSAAGEIPITVNIGTTLPVSDYVVSSGVPFSIGQLGDVNILRLVDSNNNPIAAQFTKMVSWPDNSVKVALVSFVPAVAAGGTTYENYKIIYQNTAGITSPAAINPLVISDNGSQMVLDNGISTFYVNKTNFTIFDQVKIGGVDQLQSPADLIFLDNLTNNTFKTSLAQNYTLSTVESGPLKVTLLATGKVKAVTGNNNFGENTLVTVKMWLTFFANSGQVEIKYTWIDDNARFNATNNWNGTTKYVDIKSNHLDFPLITTASTYEFGGNGANYTGSVNGTNYLLQDAAVTDTEVTKGYAGGFEYLFNYSGVGNQTATGGVGSVSPDYVGGKAQGWVDINRGTVGITAGIRDFWQNFPNKLSINDQGLLQIFVQPDESINGMYSLAPGVAKTHDIFLDFHAGASSTASVKKYKLFQEMPLIYADPAWYVQSDVFGQISVPDSNSTRWDAQIENQFTCSLNRSNCSIYNITYGKRDYGDYIMGNHPYNYANQHYEDAHGWILQYLRLGRKKYFNWSENYAKHHYDLDVMHTSWPGYSTCPAGLIHWHGGGDHERSATEGGHVVPGGIDEYFLLTGDPRALDVSKEQGDFLTCNILAGDMRIVPEFQGDTIKGIEYERAQAWSLYTILKTFESTNDIKYWDAATVAMKNSIDWWKFPQPIVVFDPNKTDVDPLQSLQSQALYYEPMDWTNGNGYFLSTMKTDNTQSTNVPISGSSSSWVYQNHVPVSWMAAYFETDIIRYLEDLKKIGGNYSKSINYRGSNQTISVDDKTINEMIVQTVNVLADHNFMGYPNHPSVFPWMSNIGNNLWAYSVSPERISSSQNSTDGGNQLPFPLLYASTIDPNNMLFPSLWQPRWAQIQAKFRDIASLSLNIKSASFNLPGDNTGYQGAALFWNEPYAMGVASKISPDVVAPSAPSGLSVL